MTQQDQETFCKKYQQILAQEVDPGDTELAFAVTLGWWEYSRPELPSRSVKTLRKILQID